MDILLWNLKDIAEKKERELKRIRDEGNIKIRKGWLFYFNFRINK
jgi:hypothetical protein